MNIEISPQNIKYLTENFNEPVLFSGFINNWPLLQWNLNTWQNKLENKLLQFRRNNFYRSKIPIWEQSCETIHMTMEDFIKFQTNVNEPSWLYFDYKYLEEWFKNNSDILNAISWENFGFPEYSGKDSTIWIGSRGAHTPCHMDTYGYNLIAQIYGKKLWILFPPEEDLNPTRVPYEESSVYSKLNFFNPCLDNLQNLSNARSIVLNPGEVLYLPPNWWHYVENLETAISVNMWIPQITDNKKRIEEAITQTLISVLAREADNKDKNIIFNPNYTDVSTTPIAQSFNLLEKVLEIYNQHKQNIPNRTENELMSISNLLKNNDIKIIPKLSKVNYLELLEQQKNRHTNVSIDQSEEASLSNYGAMTERLINSICHPEILANIVEKLLNK